MFERAKTINRQTKNNRNMQLTKSKVLGLLIATFLFTSLICYVAFSNPNLSYTTVLEEGSMNTEASYIIFEDDLTYYARNGITGAITSNTNCFTLVNNTVYALGDPSSDWRGGKILFKKGYYPFGANTLTLNAYCWGIYLEGEGMSIGSQAVYINGTADPIIQFTGNMYGGGLRHMRIRQETNGNNVGAVKFTSCHDIYVDHVFVQNGEIQMQQCHDIYIEDCLIETQNGENWGIDIEGTDVYDVWIQNNVFHDKHVGIRLRYGANRITINDNKFNQIQDQAIQLLNCSTITIQGGWTTDCSYSATGTIALIQAYDQPVDADNPRNIGITGIKVMGASLGGTTKTSRLFEHDMTAILNITIHDNHIIDIQNPAYAIHPYTTGFTVHHNVGFVTENYGFNSGTTPITVTHGLAGTPNVTLVTPNAACGNVSTTALGSTTFQIQWDGGGTIGFYWGAFYYP